MPQRYIGTCTATPLTVGGVRHVFFQSKNEYEYSENWYCPVSFTKFCARFIAQIVARHCSLLTATGIRLDTRLLPEVYVRKLTAFIHYVRCVLCQLRQDAVVSLQMIAFDAHKRAEIEQQQLELLQQSSDGQTFANHSQSSYAELCDQQLSNVTEFQQEVIIETTSTAHCVQHQRVSCSHTHMLLLSCGVFSVYFYRRQGDKCFTRHLSVC